MLKLGCLIFLLSILLQVLYIRESAGVAVTEVRLLSTSHRKEFVLQGEGATLTCHYVLEPLERVTEVEWERDGALVYLWTLADPPEAKDVLEGKVDLDEKSPSTLTIQKVTMEMQGTYSCRVRTNGKTAQNEVFLMVIVDACDESSWKTHSDMVDCTETITMHCAGIFPKPSPACGVYSERTGKYLNSVPFDSVTMLWNKTYEVGFNRRFHVREWVNHTDVTFRCYVVVPSTSWRSGIKHKMFGEPGCEDEPTNVVGGYYNMSEERSCWGFPSEGATLHYHCENNLILKGQALHSCSEGKWTPEGVIVDGNTHPPQCVDTDTATIHHLSLCTLILTILLTITVLL